MPSPKGSRDLVPETTWPTVKVRRFVSATAPDILGDPELVDAESPGAPERYETETYVPLERLKEVERQRDDFERRYDRSVQAHQKVDIELDEAQAALAERDRQVRELKDAAEQLCVQLSPVKTARTEQNINTAHEIAARLKVELRRLTQPEADPEVPRCGEQAQLVTVHRCADRHADLHSRQFAQAHEVTVAAGPLARVVGAALERLDLPVGRYAITVDRPFDADAEAEAPQCSGDADCKCPYCTCPTCGRSFDCQPTPELLGEDSPLRPASKAHLELVKAVLVCLEKGIWPETIRRFVDEELVEAGHPAPSPVGTAQRYCCEDGEMRPDKLGPWINIEDLASTQPVSESPGEADGDRLYSLLAFFDLRDGSALSHLVRSAREGFERSHPDMGANENRHAWEEFDSRWNSFDHQEERRKLVKALRTRSESESPGGFCDQCEKPKAEVACLVDDESLCASCLLVRVSTLLKEAEGHDYKLTDADAHCPFCGQGIAGSESPGDSGEGQEQFLALRDRLLGDKATRACFRAVSGCVPEPTAEELEDIRLGIAAAWNVATVDDLSLLLTQPVPGNSGGVAEALELLREDEALNRLAVYVFRYMLSYDEAITNETAMSAALDHVAAALERTDRNPDEIRESLEAEAAAASTQPPSPQAEVQDCERVVRSGKTDAGAEYRAHFTGDPDPETVEAVETLVDAAHAKMSAEAEGRCGGTGELWTQPPEGHIGSMKRPCLGCPDCTGKQPPAEPQGDVVEKAVDWVEERTGLVANRELFAALVAYLTPLLALEVKERLGSDEIKHLIATVVIRKHNGYGVDDEGMPHDAWGKPMTATRNHAEKTARHIVEAVLAALTPALSEPEQGR
jgi:hypothetical protein